MKSSTDRIRYYTRKVREYSALRRSITARYRRLMAYKQALNKRLQSIGGRYDDKNR